MDPLARCDRELAALRATYDQPAWAIALGELDWMLERELILEEEFMINSDRHDRGREGPGTAERDTSGQGLKRLDSARHHVTWQGNARNNREITASL